MPEFTISVLPPPIAKETLSPRPESWCKVTTSNQVLSQGIVPMSLSLGVMKTVNEPSKMLECFALDLFVSYPCLCSHDLYCQHKHRKLLRICGKNLGAALPKGCFSGWGASRDTHLAPPPHCCS